MNLATRELELVYDDPQWSDVDPIPLAPHAAPPARPSVLAGRSNAGLIYCNSVFNSDVVAGAALGPKARNELDDQVNLVRQQRVEVDERGPREFRQPCESLTSRPVA